MEIEPKYVTFDQAKWLKEKGFNLPTLNWYHRGNKKFNTNDLLFSMNRLTDNYSAPEQWQVVEWLRVNHGVWVYVKLGYGHEFVIQKALAPFEIIYADGTFNSPQEAYSAAFDYILKELI
jgi:hypothetical protein